MGADPAGELCNVKGPGCDDGHSNALLCQGAGHSQTVNVPADYNGAGRMGSHLFSPFSRLIRSLNFLSFLETGKISVSDDKGSGKKLTA
jgi:hypothetical protein